MAREVTDADNVRWTCAQPYAGLEATPTDAATTELARVPGSDRVTVVCTPSGGAQSKRIELATDWETTLSDEALAQAIVSA